MVLYSCKTNPELKEIEKFSEEEKEGYKIIEKIAGNMFEDIVMKAESASPPRLRQSIDKIPVNK